MWRPLKAMLVAAIVAGGGLLTLANWPLHPAPRIYHLPAGTTMRHFADMLRHRHVIAFVDPFLALAHITGNSDALKAGYYRFRNPTTPLQILDKVVSGRVIQYAITFIPGWTFAEVRHALAHGPLRDNIRKLSAAAVMARIGHRGQSAQGQFFPDTYFYIHGATATSILARAYNRLHRLLAADWRQRLPGLPLQKPEQALILASLIEKETAMRGERREIAGVFVNRLRLNMPLETDPTVIFCLGRRYHGVLTAQDLDCKSPYNTYLHRGLPPTPIGLPSARALYAALHPRKTKALYFVATGLGGHVFSDTLQEQDKEIIKYELHSHP